MNNYPLTFYSSHMYLITSYFALLSGYIYSFILLFYLYLGSVLNHLNPYTDKCRFDFIDIFDRVLLVCVIGYFIYHYHSNLSLWFALLYLIVCYFFIMPYCCIQNRIIIHCSFHFVTAITAIYLLSI